MGGAIGDATTINLEAWDRDFRINVTSMVLMSRHAIPEMRKEGRGSIINMSSVSGRTLIVFLYLSPLLPFSANGRSTQSSAVTPACCIPRPREPLFR